MSVSAGDRPGGAVVGRRANSIDDLLAIETIHQLKYQYFRFLDQKQWTALGDLLTADVVASYGGGAYAFVGRTEVVAFLERSMGREDFLSSHRGHHPEITFVGDHEAHGVWAFDDEVLIGEWNLAVRGAGLYHDVYVRDSDAELGWAIAQTGYRRSFEQLFPLDAIAGHKITASWWGTDGRSTLSA